LIEATRQLYQSAFFKAIPKTKQPFSRLPYCQLRDKSQLYFLSPSFPDPPPSSLPPTATAIQSVTSGVILICLLIRNCGPRPRLGPKPAMNSASDPVPDQYPEQISGPGHSLRSQCDSYSPTIAGIVYLFFSLPFPLFPFLSLSFPPQRFSIDNIG